MPTDNEITREQNFIDRMAVFKKRTTDFFADYENPNGSEDRLEICLIRDGYRAVSQAEEIINRQKAENKRLERKIEDLESMQEISPEAKHFVDTKADKMISLLTELNKSQEQIKAEAVKEFAERLCEDWRKDEDEMLCDVDIVKWILDTYKEMAGAESG